MACNNFLLSPMKVESMLVCKPAYIVLNYTHTLLTDKGPVVCSSLYYIITCNGPLIAPFPYQVKA